MSPTKPVSWSAPRAMGKAAAWALAAAALTVAWGAALGPHPAACTGWAARWEYNAQVLLMMTGVRSEWDLARMERAMARSCSPAAEERHTPRLDPLPEIDALGDPDWRDKLRAAIVDQRQAVVVRGVLHAATDVFAPEARSWGLDFLESRVFGDGALVPVFMDAKRDDSMEWMPFSALADELRARKPTTKYGRCLPDRGGVLHRSMNLSALARTMHKEAQHWMTKSIGGGLPHCLFVSSDQVRTRMHSDTQTNAFVMIEGRKKWTFFAPSEGMYLLPVGQGFNLAYNSLVDVFKLDNETYNQREFPFLRHARGFQTVINAGDAVFHPSFWWHGVENLDPVSVGMDVPFLDVTTGIQVNPVLTLGTVLTPVLNPRALSLLAWELLTSEKTNIKEVFFHHYYKDDSQRELAKSQRNVVRAQGVVA